LLDTGHMLIGGTDPVKFARENFSRIDHFHVKDVKMEIAKRFLAGEITLMEATRDGVFCAAGDGDVKIAEAIEVMESNGYEGWYVLEQDMAIVGDQPRDAKISTAGVRRSISFLAQLK